MSAKIGFCFPKGLGLDPGPVFRGCQLLSLKPRMAGWLHKGSLIQNYNSAAHETLQNLSAVNFSRFSTFSKLIWCDAIILDEIVFFSKSDFY